MTLSVPEPWEPSDRDDVLAFVVDIQQNEFGLEITAGDQPDLADVEPFYRRPGGEFWVARDGGAVVGTIGAIAIAERIVVLRKMFVARSHRGSAGLADQLMNTLVDWATSTGHVSIVLGTTDRMKAAHRFYAKHHFVPLEADHLPADFPRMAVDSLFFRRDLAEVEPS